MGDKQPTEHLSDADVLALTEGHASADAEVHLLLCRPCRELYDACATARFDERVSPASPRVRRLPMWIGSAGLLAVAAALVALVLLPRGNEALDFRDLLPETMHAEVEKVSAQWMVFPGFESMADGSEPLLRSRTERSGAYENLVKRELERMEFGSASAADFARGITGLVLDQELVEAWKWSSQAVEVHPRDERIWFLRALVAQRMGELDRAERILRRLCEEGEPAGVYCLDLLLVQAQRGDEGEARELLRVLRDANAAIPILLRAERATADL